MLIRNLRLIDGAGDIHDGVDVLIRDGRFAEIGPGLDADGEELDAGGATAIPGSSTRTPTSRSTRRPGRSSRHATCRTPSRRRKRRSAPLRCWATA